ncbi:MAG: hypothetical protein ACRD0J_13295 [Acidimicrobiales bacterium]
MPPPDVPLAFLGCSGLGLIATGAALMVLAAQSVAEPTADPVISVVHLGMLAFLSTAVLGALHQFAPVVSRRALRSVPVARASVVCFVVGAWGLAGSFALSDNRLLGAAGGVIAVAVVAIVWNLSGPLWARHGGTPVTGLRWSMVGLVGVVAFGATYVADRGAHEAWFGLDPHLVLAHAHLGLLGFLGLAYVAVAEKLWPMFLLAHRPGPSPGRFAVRLVPAGLALLVAGLAAGVGPLATAGAVVVAAGLAAHLASFAGLVRHRRRPLELLHVFVITSAGALVVAGGLGAASAWAQVSSVTRAQLVGGEIAALAGWVTLALVGHAHKVVPFITWGILRRQGVRTGPSGRPLVFSDLYNPRVARVTYAAAVVGVGGAVAGLAGGVVALVLVGGAGLMATGALALVNLGLGPFLVRHRVRSNTLGQAVASGPAGPEARAVVR